jgi:addiction module HigA family antidote
MLKLLIIIKEDFKLTTNQLRPVHPGEVLREDYLKPLGLSANALAIALRIPASRVNDIVLERRSITPDTALRLARYFGGDAQSWLNLQTAYDLKIATAELGSILKAIEPRVA